MSSKLSVIGTVAVLALTARYPQETQAFAPVAPFAKPTVSSPSCITRFMSSEDTAKTTESATAPAATTAADETDAAADSKEVDIDLKTVESLGRGAAKAKRGKRKGPKSKPAAAPAKAAAALKPEEVYYEGPPAITETIAPTLSILTVVGIIPAAAAWARQAWVRYKITSRRIRVTSGIGGRDMAEIVYPDIVEIRTAKRLFGDGDMVAFLRDGAKFEMRNIPNFEEAMEFVLKQVDKDVAEKYREKGDVTKP